MGDGTLPAHRVGPGGPGDGIQSAGTVPEGIFHSETGTQYTSIAFGQRCDELEISRNKQ
jgi:hypothetical protein